MKRLIRSLLGALWFASVLAGDRWDANANLWLNYVGVHPLGETRWGLHLEGQVRRSDLGRDWQQLLLRPGINYRLNPTTQFSAGYAWVETHPYGDFPIAHKFPEHRIWEQISITRPWLQLDWSHRVRLEQRWIGEMGRNPGGDWEVANHRFENRIRYQLRTSVALNKTKTWYLPIWNEVFVNFGPNVSRNYFDQNRFFIGLGRKLPGTLRVEAGFMEQTLQRRGGATWEQNHTFTIWLFSQGKIPF